MTTYLEKTIVSAMKHFNSSDAEEAYQKVATYITDDARKTIEELIANGVVETYVPKTQDHSNRISFLRVKPSKIKDISFKVNAKTRGSFLYPVIIDNIRKLGPKADMLSVRDFLNGTTVYAKLTRERVHELLHKLGYLEIDQEGFARVPRSPRKRTPRKSTPRKSTPRKSSSRKSSSSRA